ncbi:hypothetical protein AB9N12_08565 [Bacteroides sp. AN502(2024)]|uniref:hypothetical protein n=1 Tax=Bacteroides sp. AN502(2024) TaxID=3160599 RepID=UPI003516EBD3
MKQITFVHKTWVLLLGILAIYALPVQSQEKKDEFYNRYKDYREVLRDTADYVAPLETQVRRDSILDPVRVVTNKFGKNWFFFATGGLHTFRGDYSNWGKFNGTLSPEWSVGMGKWFTPGIGLKMEFIRSQSKGYTAYTKGGYYGYGDILNGSKGEYRKMKTGWWDISASAILNLSRLFLGYEGYYSPKRMNQFMLNAGIGGVHHLGYEHSHGSDNEWSGHLELQYSRFFNKKKRVSLDIKARGLFYQTNFDLEYGQNNYAAHKWDLNAGIHVGFTLYLDKARSNGWAHGRTQLYQRDYRERKILVVREREKMVDYGTMTFYVFYPNNYSGRDDAPQNATATVNAIDYLAGGIFTQKKYVDDKAVDTRMNKGLALEGLSIADLPTENADKNFDINYVPRGYEMLKDRPLSLSLNTDDMKAFRQKAGFYYAPIFDGLHAWQYRIDNATQRQQLLSSDNYMETASFGLNAHNGLDIIRRHMSVDEKDELVSFADVYAAMNSNEGYIAQFTDAATVERIKDILENGYITMIQAEGLATSQDNYTGANADQVGIQRNSALSQNRANTVISWLKGKKQLNEVASQIYLVNRMDNGISPVEDRSTRGLDAKLNRCTKIRIHYMLKSDK